MSNQEEIEDYKLFELDFLEKLYKPIQGSTRVKYTCIDVSASYVVLGATSGSLYLFQRNLQLNYLKVVTSQEGPVTTIRVSPNEKYVAVATNKGIVSIVQLEAPSKLLHVSKDHSGFAVTCLCWNFSSDGLYIGDDKGKVTSINLTLKKAHSIFQATTALIVKLDCKVVQLDSFDNFILISCYTATYLCDIVKERYSKIGTKLRDGPFGSCFYMRKIIYCARPGQRLWEADLKGRVLFTHQLKQALSKSSTPVIDISNDAYLSLRNTSCSQGVNFNRLSVVCNRFIVTFGGTYIFVFDPPTAGIILWSFFESEIKDVKVVGCEIFIHFVEGNFKHFYLLPVLDGINKLIKSHHWKLAANLCNLYKDKIYLSSSKIQNNHLQLILKHLSADEQISKAIKEIIIKLEELYPPEEVNANTAGYTIESGIFVVNRPENVNAKTIEHSPMPKFTSSNEPFSNVYLDPLIAGSNNLGIVMPFLVSPFLDPDFANIGFDAISALKYNVSFDDLKSKYNIGKDKILATMGQLEDRIKGAHTSHTQFLLDVKTVDIADNLSGIDDINKKSETLNKTSKQQMPLYLQNLLNVCSAIWAKLPTLSNEKETLLSLLNHWIRVLNTTVANHYRYSKHRGQSQMQKSVSCDSLAISLTSRRRNTYPSIHHENAWSFEDFYLYEIIFNNEKRKSMFDWLQQWHTFHFSNEDCFKLSQLTSLCFSNRVFGQIADYADESEDYVCSLFINFHFGLLSPRAVRLELERDLGKSYKQSWTSLITCVIDSKMPKEEFAPLIECYRLIYSEKLPDLFLVLSEKLKRVFHLVTPRDVYYLDDHAKLNGCLLMSFMDEAFDKHFFRACEDPLVSELWMKSILETNLVPSWQLQCKCNIPKAGSHKYQWQRNEILLQIIRSSNITDTMRETLKKFGYWYGYILACHQATLRMELISTLVHLSDIDLFEDPFNSALLPQTDEEWKLMFDMTTKLTGQCSTCGDDLTYDSWLLITFGNLATFSLNYVNPKFVMNYLSTLTPKPQLSSQFFRKIAISTFKKTKQRTEYSGGINHFIWSQFRDYASTDIRSKLLSETFKTPNIPVIDFKDNKSHWGVSLDIKSLCFKCLLPLIVPLTENINGIRVFYCGHSFHLFCIKDDNSVCLKCKTTSQLH